MMSFFIYLSLLISFFTFLFPILVGNLLGSKGVAIIVIGNYFMLYSISIVLLLLLFILGDHSNIIICDWVSLHLLNIQYSFFIDSFSVIMFFLITFISLLVQIYSYEYLLYDPHLPRYYAYLGLFTFFMIFLIFSIDFLQFFLAWEGVGICSYLLINFWYLRFKASKSAILAVLVNKIGDIFLLVSICLVHTLFYTTDLDFIRICTNYISSLYMNQFDFLFLMDNNLKVVKYFFDFEVRAFKLDFFFMNISTFFFMLLIASIGKSAQFIFYIWLPEAMEGPTPVSALLHAATMVTLGIFLILRMSDILAQHSYLLVWLLFIGSLTIIVVSFISVLNSDLKKVIAFSTCSQLGYMFIGCGCGEFIETVYSLVLHAFFKAMLFLAAGYIIYLSSSEQDIRTIGGFYWYLNLIYIVFLVGTCSAIGISSFGNSIPKEKILEFCISIGIPLKSSEAVSLFIIFNYIPSICILLTSVYSIILLSEIFFYTFSISRFSSFLYIVQNNISPSILLSFPLLLLSLLSIFVGYHFNDFFIGDGSFFLFDTLYISDEASIYSSNFEIQNTFSLQKGESVEVNILFDEYLDWLVEQTLFFDFFFTTSIVLLQFLIFPCVQFVYLTTNLTYTFFSILKIKILNRYYTFFLFFLFFHIIYTTFYRVLDKGLLEYFSTYSIVKNFKILQYSYFSKITNYIYHAIGFFLITILFIILLYI